MHFISAQIALIRIFLLFVIVFTASTVRAQKTYSLSSSVNFNFGVKGIAVNDAGIGLKVTSNFFATKKLQLRTEASMESFIGDKQLYIDSFGKHHYGNPTMVGLSVGPELSVTKNVSVSAVYGFVSYKLFGNKIWEDKINLTLTTCPGAKKNFLLGFSYSFLPAPSGNAKFYGINIGYKIF